MGLGASTCCKATVPDAAPEETATTEQSAADQRRQLRALARENRLQLPRLPLPEVKATLERLVESCRACSESPEELAALERAAVDLGKGEAARLQEAIAPDDGPDGLLPSWLQPHWDAMYSGLRDPAPIGRSCFVGIEGQGALRCAKFALAFCKWTRKVLEGNLEAGVPPLCLTAMAKLFSSAKIPRRGADVLHQDAPSSNVVLISGGRIWSIDVFSDGKLLAPETLAQEMERARRAPALPAAESLPIITAANRDVWADEREALMSDAGNRANLELIDRAIIVVALDKALQEAPEAKTKNWLFGEASSRWWDKHQLILGATGSMAINFEPSACDASHWCRVVEECMAEVAREGQRTYGPLPRFEAYHEAEIRELRFAVPASTRQAIRAALPAYERARAGLCSECLEYRGWGRDEAQDWGVPPDAAVQMALHIAYCRLHGRVGPAAEAVSMRRFFAGRTETVRSCTAEAREMCRDWRDGPGGAGSLLRAAARHSGLVQAAQAGGGIDRHLFALERFAQAGGEDIALFRDPLFLRSKASAMATSNVTGPFVSCCGLVPAHSQGRGIGCTVKASSLSVCISAFALGGEGPRVFAEILAQVLDDVKAVLARSAAAEPAAAAGVRRHPSLLGAERLGSKKPPAPN